MSTYSTNRLFFFYFQIRGIVSGLAVCMAYFSSFLSVFTFKFIQSYLGNLSLYLILGMSSVSVAGITKVCMPETKGKTEKEIAEFYKKWMIQSFI